MATDIRGRTFTVGQRVVRGRNYGIIEIAEVTKVDGDKVYLNHSTVPMKFTERLAILD